MFLLYYPLKQGLKQPPLLPVHIAGILFLLYYPLKQGLKQKAVKLGYSVIRVFTLLSIKTRIETSYDSKTSSP